jgi:hypothetical protein
MKRLEHANCCCCGRPGLVATLSEDNELALCEACSREVAATFYAVGALKSDAPEGPSRQTSN